MSSKRDWPGAGKKIQLLDKDIEEQRRLVEVARSAVASGALKLADILEISDEQIEAFLEHGIRLFRMRKFDEARNTLELLLMLSPHHAQGWRAFGALMQETEHFDEAVYAYNLTLIHAPDDAVAMMYKGQALLRLDRRDEAIEFLKRGIEAGAKDGALEPWVQRSRAVLSAVLANGQGDLAPANTK